MKRCPFAFEILMGETGAFRRKLGAAWPQITEFLDRNHIHNFSLWSCGQLAFGYCEREDEEKLTGKERAALSDLLEAFTDCVSWIAQPGDGMRLMYHDFGIVRENKELIRHRVFMTKLKPDCAEEYKRGHDALVEVERLIMLQLQTFKGCIDFAEANKTDFLHSCFPPFLRKMSSSSVLIR